MIQVIDLYFKKGGGGSMKEIGWWDLNAIQLKIEFLLVSLLGQATPLLQIYFPCICIIYVCNLCMIYI